ncbi:CCD13 protein, partial [Polypterus senegalus]|nr:CCD13 protein [Polypterus senegalus]
MSSGRECGTRAPHRGVTFVFGPLPAPVSPLGVDQVAQKAHKFSHFEKVDPSTESFAPTLPGILHPTDFFFFFFFRLDEMKGLSLEAEQKLQEERKKAVVLEKQLEKNKLERNGQRSKVTAGEGGSTHGHGVLEGLAIRSPQRTGPMAGDPSALMSFISGAMLSSSKMNKTESLDVAPAGLAPGPLEAQIEELNVRLTSQMEQNATLKMALRSSQKSKEDDLKLYNEMMRQVKQVFLQALWQHRQDKKMST